MKTYKIHLIRHGATDANILGQYIGQRTDTPLSPEGLNELRLLKDNLEYPNIGRLYSSPMLRCKQTAAVLYPDKEIITVPNMTEFDFGDFDGKTARELESNQAFKDFTSGKITAPPNGEDNTEFVQRICIGLNLIVNDMMQNNVNESAVIMHGGAIMMLLGATAVPRKHTAEWTSDNGRGYTLRITPSLYHKSGIVEVVDII